MPGGGRGGGREKKKIGFKLEVLAPAVSFTSGPADTLPSQPAPAFDPGDKQGAPSILGGGEGLPKVPRGEPWPGSGTAAAFLPERLRCAAPRAACV